jgi:hypothetical protein
LLIEAIKDQQKMIEEMKNKINILIDNNDSLGGKK